MCGSNLEKGVFKTVNVSLLKSDKPFSTVWVCWNDLGKSVKIRSIQVGLEGFL